MQRPVPASGNALRSEPASAVEVRHARGSPCRSPGGCCGRQDGRQKRRSRALRRPLARRPGGLLSGRRCAVSRPLPPRRGGPHCRGESLRRRRRQSHHEHVCTSRAGPETSGTRRRMENDLSAIALCISLTRSVVSCTAILRHVAVTCFDRPGAGGVLALRHGWSSESDDEKGGPRGLQAPGTFRDSGREEAAVQADTWVVTLIRHRGSAYSNGGAGFPDYLAQGLTQMGVPGAAASPRAGDARQWQRRPLIPAWRVRRSLLDQALRHQVRAGSCRPDKPAPGA
jgi:hypothetical protein